MIYFDSSADHHTSRTENQEELKISPYMMSAFDDQFGVS